MEEKDRIDAAKAFMNLVGPEETAKFIAFANMALDGLNENNRTLGIAFRCALQKAELAATVPPVGAANNRSDEIAWLEKLSFYSASIDKPETVGQFLCNAINERVAQLRAMR